MIELCTLCKRQLNSDLCQVCEDCSQFEPDPTAALPAAYAKRPLGIADLADLTANGRLAFVLWAVQGRREGENDQPW